MFNFNFFKKKKESKDIYTPIFIGGAYIFDPLGESNQSVDTTAVTVIKKGTHSSNSYIVMSINNGNVFECDRELLVPVTNYDAIEPLIRIQYGTSDITKEDYHLYELLVGKLMTHLKEEVKTHDDDNEFKQFVNFLDESAKELSDKLKKYSDVSEYKYMLETITCLKEHQQKHFDTMKELDKEKEEKKTEREKIVSELPKEKIKKYQEEVQEVINESPFYNKFNELTREYLNPFKNVSVDDYIEKAIWLMEDEFPIKALIPPCEELKMLTYEDINYEKKMCSKFIRKRCIVFLIGANSLGEKKAIGIYDMDDFDMIDKFLYEECYDGWKNKKLLYRAEYHAVMINVPYKEGMMGQFPPYFDNNEEEEDYE